ncbi:MAG: c-type cytochrome [Bdellovibrionales bacterium]|nr:c-type cytochrome [Bdellovibrionales bacterium]
MGYVRLSLALTALLAIAPGVRALDPIEDSLELRRSGQSVAKLALSDIRGKVEPTAVVVSDPFEGEEAAYLAFRFNIILTLFFGNGWQQWDELLFTSTDGAQALVPVDQFIKHTAQLAFAEPDGKEFSLDDKLTGRGRQALEPYYLVWDNLQDIEMAEKGADGWVMRVKSVEIIRFDERFPNTAPPKEASKIVRDGFVAFRKHCMSCHRVNGEGGEDGVELNYPMSVTEYLKEDYLSKWILAPQDLRLETKMAGISKDLRDRDLVADDIIAYLKAMASEKRDPKDAARGFSGLVPKTVPKRIAPQVTDAVKVSKKKKPSRKKKKGRR